MKTILLSVLALLLSLNSTALAQENGELGRMWTFENPPFKHLEKKYGFKPDQQWLDTLRLGSLRLGGENVLSTFGSASFVSPKGLIMTSNRSVREAVAETRDPEERARGKEPLGIVATGFVAAVQEQEIRLRTRRNGWLSASQVVEISNITDAVNKDVKRTDDEIQIKAKRDANKKTILDEARKTEPELVPQIVSLYQGAVFQLYQYKVYDDIRLVCIPHLQTAHFGGNPDDFTYPRHSLDFAFLRAYEDDKPADTSKHYFRWKSGGAKKDELVFVSGNPGTTSRLLTKAQLEFERDIRLWMKIERLANVLRINSEELFEVIRNQQRVLTRLLGWENDLKAARGNLLGLEDAQLMTQKTVAEQAFRDRVKANEEFAKKYGDLWDRIASMIQERRQHEARAQFHSTGGMAPLDMAVAVVRSCDPDASEKHRKEARKKLEGWRTGGIPSYVAYVLFEDHVDRARGWLPKDDPLFTKVLGGKSGSEFFGRKVPGIVPYEEPRNALVKSGWRGILESKDPLVVAARELVILMRKNKKHADELDAKEQALGAELGRALLACYGTNVSPDATNTLRFTDGVVRGFPFNGTITPHRTSFYGLYAGNAEFDNEYPFNLPKIWLDRKDKIDMNKTVNFVSNNDINGAAGSSGSVVVNKQLEIVGVVVDGNIESLHNDFVFNDDVPRAVSVHVDGIMEALTKIYDANRVVLELTGK